MFSSINDIERYLLQYVPNSTSTRFPAQDGIIRTKEFLRLLGSPQNKLKVIHIAGTSGKGSTSFMISSFLHVLGLKVGLHLSPHLLDIRERVEINNKLISEKKYIRYFEEIIPIIERMRNSSYGTITYFELLVGFTYYVFAKEHVDYAIMEVGLGGEYDGTNVVDRQDKLSVITKIGFDHMKVLGNTITQITHQKATICVEKGTMISIYQTPSAKREIAQVAKVKNARLLIVGKKAIYAVSMKNEKAQFSFIWDGVRYDDLTLGLFGAHQAQNATLALAAVLYVGFRDHFIVDMQKIRGCARHLHFKGRMDIVHRNKKTIILDGAHNDPKMKAFLKALTLYSPHKKYLFVIAFKKGKEFQKMIKLIIPFAKKIIVTTIFSNNQDLMHFSTDPKAIRDELIYNGFTNVIIEKKFSKIKERIEATQLDVVITGSLYLLGDIYKLLDSKL